MAATGELGAKSRKRRVRPHSKSQAVIEPGQFPGSFQESLAWQNWEYEQVDVDPRDPTHARPGTEEKVRMMAARYASGLPLWHHEDCSDHASAGTDAKELPINELLALEVAQGRIGR